MKDQIIQRLEPLINNPVVYGGQQVTIKKYEFDDERERVFIHFHDRGTLDRPYESAEMLIDMFEPVPQIKDRPQSLDVTVPGRGAIQMPFLDDGSVLDKVTNILLEDIDSIKSGDLSLEKAEARSKNIDQIIEVQKTKVAKAAVMAKFLGK